MVVQKVKYGILTSWICTYVLKRERENGIEYLYISRPIWSTFDDAVAETTISSSSTTTSDGQRLPLHLFSVLVWLQHIVLMDLTSTTELQEPAQKEKSLLAQVISSSNSTSAGAISSSSAAPTVHHCEDPIAFVTISRAIHN